VIKSNIERDKQN